MSRKHKKLRVWLTGAGGQLGNAITRHFQDSPKIQWLPTTRFQVDVSSLEDNKRFFDVYKPDVIVNSAAFTSIDGAELSREEAKLVNATVPGFLAELCNNAGKVFMHISTDHVFGGQPLESPKPLKETDPTCPCNEYGRTKLLGEQEVLRICPRSYIWRTSWLYSPYGNNLYKKIIRMAREKDEMSMVTDEIGSPTSALDLAETIVKSLLRLQADQDKIPFGLYHYANKGAVSRYEFAHKLLQLNPETKDLKIKKVLQKEFEAPTRAKRPLYSVLDTTKIESVLPDSIHPWEESLEKTYQTSK